MATIQIAQVNELIHFLKSMYSSIELNHPAEGSYRYLNRIASDLETSARDGQIAMVCSLTMHHAVISVLSEMISKYDFIPFRIPIWLLNEIMSKMMIIMCCASIDMGSDFEKASADLVRNRKAGFREYDNAVPYMHVLIMKMERNGPHPTLGGFHCDVNSILVSLFM